MKVKRILSLVLVLIMAAALFVGCNGNDTTTTTTAPTGDGTTLNPNDVERKDGVINEEVTKKITSYEVNNETYEVGQKQEREITFKGTIKIGNAAATTGAFAAVGLPFNSGLEAYVNRINFNGGVGGDFAAGKKGYYIEFIHYDDGFAADTGSAYTKKLVEEDKVFALVGHFGSPTVGATIDYIKETGVIACYFASGVGTLFNTEADATKNGSTLFPVQPIYTTEGRIIVARILEQYPDAKKIGVVYTNDEAGEGLRDGAKAQIEALGSGFECVLSEVSTDATDFTPAVTKVADCDAIIVAAIQKGTVSIIKAMIANGIYKPSFSTYSVASAQTLIEVKPFYDALAEENKFPIYANAWLSSTDLEAFAEFGVDVIACTGENTLTLNSYAMAGWISATIFCEGLERVIADGKELTNLTYVEAMESDIINIKMGGSTLADGTKLNSTLDYSDGFRIGTTTMSLLKNNEACNNFEEAAGMKNFLKFMQTGDIADIA